MNPEMNLPPYAPGRRSMGKAAAWTVPAVAAALSTSGASASTGSITVAPGQPASISSGGSVCFTVTDTANLGAVIEYGLSDYDNFEVSTPRDYLAGDGTYCVAVYRLGGPGPVTVFGTVYSPDGLTSYPASFTVNVT